MACKTSFELHHNFPKLAEESGFTFNTHKPRVHINWNKIKLIDIENLIKERNFVLVEQHINDILDCVLESEFDVRILDEGVLKIFRLAQLAVEYQQFCRHYLDRSIFVLREEVTNLLQDLDSTKKSLREKDEENRKLRRKSKHSIRTLPYGNENIATMILKTLNQNKGELFPSTSQVDAMQYNKCSYCEKVFLNQLYLKSHISRRHSNILEIPQKDTIDGEMNNGINATLASEVNELKTKLKQMEELMSNMYNPNNQISSQAGSQNENIKKDEINNIKSKKETKDAAVSTNEQANVLNKIEEWKKEEYEKYNAELSLLRKQIIDIINTKEKQDNISIKSELNMIDQLRATIKEQGTEVLALKQELLKGEYNEKEKRKEIEEKMAFWIKRAEIQSNEYKSLLQKLDDAATEAQEFRMQANVERERVKQLEEILKNHIEKAISTSPKQTHIIPLNTVNKQKVTKHTKVVPPENESTNTINDHVKPSPDVITLKKLQEKAQALLNIDQTSTSDSSSANEDKVNTAELRKEFEFQSNTKKKTKYDKARHEQGVIQPESIIQNSDEVDQVKKKHKEKKKSKPTINATSKKGNGYVYVPGSPLKVIRAKITEEVNHRLISLGVDPLNSRLPPNVFQKQRKLLQEQQEYKFKKWPAREIVLHSIICQLDQNTCRTNSLQTNDHTSPNKSFSLSTILSNVKMKALSLVKSNEIINKSNKSYDDVAKKAMALLKTPPGSSHSSPVISHHTNISSPEKKAHILNKKKNEKHISKLKQKNKPVQNNEINDSSNESYSESCEQNVRSPKTFNQLVKNPLRQTKYNTDSYNMSNQKNTFHHEDIVYSNKEINGSKPKSVIAKSLLENKDNSSDDIESIIDISPRKFLSQENLSNSKQTKGVLKNASSSSSLNKKKVLFDMDAIQMKSVSASPSQSVTEKSDNERHESPIVNFDTEEWDISSIENEPVKNIGNKIQISSRTSPKIAELKQTIESQLTRRNPTLSTALVGGVDVLATSMQKATSFGGSNTSLGSSILDDTDNVPEQAHKTIVKPRTAFEKDDSEIEISDIINDKMMNKKY